MTKTNPELFQELCDMMNARHEPTTTGSRDDGMKGRSVGSCRITMGPTGRDDFAIYDRNGVKVDLDVTSIVIRMECEGSATATVTLSDVVVDAQVRHLLVDNEWPELRDMQYWPKLSTRLRNSIVRMLHPNEGTTQHARQFGIEFTAETMFGPQAYASKIILGCGLTTVNEARDAIDRWRRSGGPR